MGLFRKIIIGLLFVFLATSVIRNYLEYRKNYSFYEDFKTTFESEQKKNTSLKTEILKSTDPHEIEKTIRNRLDLLKPGEVSVILPNPTPTPAVITPTPAPAYAQWIHTFFAN